jgi:hypothetical protein
VALPDSAFDGAMKRLGGWLDVVNGSETPEELREATDNFCRAFGLEEENDERSIRLSRAVLATLRHVHVDDVPDEDVSLAVFGISLGLVLAEQSGWDPPITP